MKLRINLNDEDYMRYNEYVTLNSRYGKRSAFFHRIGVPGIAAVILIVLLVGGLPLIPFLVMAAVLIMLSMFWYRMAPAIFRRNLRKNVTRIARGGVLPYHAEFELEFQDESVIETTPAGMKEYRYRDLIAQETDAYWYLFYNELQGIILPKRELGTQKAEVESYLRRI